MSFRFDGDKMTLLFETERSPFGEEDPDMPEFIRLTTLDDPRLTPFRNLRERTLRGESLFIAEGRLVTERLFVSPFAVESVLTTRETLSTLPDDFFSIPKLDGVPVYLLPEKELFSGIVGFPFHQGMLAVGRRRPLPTFVEAVRSRRAGGSDSGEIWVVLPDATKPDNLGLAFRSAAALGATGVVLGESCCDPFSRRALRVSMGGVLQVPVAQAQNLRSEIETLRREPSPIRFYATLLAPDAVPLPSLTAVPRRSAILFGNEYHGLSAEMSSLCDEKLTIPMSPGVDSLNLGVSVGVFLYEFLRLLRG